MKSIIIKILRIKLFLQSSIAAFARQLDAKILITIGFIATSFAIFQFASDRIGESKARAKSDGILKMRFSSPAPAKNILIVDIDERSLALIAPAKGNWPWPRDTLADGLQKLSDFESKAILFNVLMSDPDKRNPDSDSVMAITSEIVTQTAFPAIRLNPKNDLLSKLDLSKFPNVEITDKNKENKTIAAIIPFFTSMQGRIGIADQRPDPDGIVRNYGFNWTEEGFKLPSIVKMTAIAGNADITMLPDEFTLNWRNKKDRYTRISFVDVLSMDSKSPEAYLFKDAYIILGVSAPGIGQIKPTAVKAIEDDNEILATALDDALNKTYFRVTPDWILLLITIISIWALIILGINRVNPLKINKAFVLLQIGLGGVTLLAASYTYFLIDLSNTMTIALGVFAAVKLIRTMSDNAARAKSGYRVPSFDLKLNEMLLIGFKYQEIGFKKSRDWEKRIQKIAGMQNIIRIDDLYGGNSFVSDLLSEYQAFIVITNIDKKEEILKIIDSSNVKIIQEKIPDNMDFNSKKFQALAAEMLSKNSASIFSINN